MGLISGHFSICDNRERHTLRHAHHGLIIRFYNDNNNLSDTVSCQLIEAASYQVSTFQN